ncbi:unnamed protein product, partial [Scytosiphon promiscuus]
HGPPGQHLVLAAAADGEGPARRRGRPPRRAHGPGRLLLDSARRARAGGGPARDGGGARAEARPARQPRVEPGGSAALPPVARRVGGAGVCGGGRRSRFVYAGGGRADGGTPRP